MIFIKHRVSVLFVKNEMLFQGRPCAKLVKKAIKKIIIITSLIIFVLDVEGIVLFRGKPNVKSALQKIQKEQQEEQRI